MTDLSSNTRRGLLGWGARVALGLSAVLVGAQVVHADDDDDDDRRGRGRGRFVQPRVESRNVTFSADLVPIQQVNTSDFNPGGSDTGSGFLSVGSRGATTAALFVSLRGATPNLTYNVQFVPLNNAGARQNLGSFTTNDAGNGNVEVTLGESGSAPDNLGTRVGSFLIARNDNGNAAFVTAA